LTEISWEGEMGCIRDTIIAARKWTPGKVVFRLGDNGEIVEMHCSFSKDRFSMKGARP